MRTISNASAIKTPHTISASLVLRDRRTSFVDIALSDPAVITHDLCVDDVIVRVASVGYSEPGEIGNPSIPHEYLWFQVTDTVTFDWVNTYFDMKIGSKPSVWYENGAGVFVWQNLTNKIVTTAFTVSGLVLTIGASTERTILDTETYWISCLSATEYAYMKVKDLLTGQTVYDCKVGIYPTPEFVGAVYSTVLRQASFFAVRNGGVTSIFFQEANGNRPVCLACTQNGTLYDWSGFERVYPLDALDTSSSFRITGCAVIDGQIVVTGKLNRSELSTGSFHAMLVKGSYEYIHGRNFVTSIATGDGGKPFIFDNELWVIGPYLASHSPIPYVLGGSVTSVSIPLVDTIQITEDDLGMSLDVELDISYKDIVQCGMDLEAIVSLNGTSASVGVFSVESIRASSGCEASMIVSARDMASKDLNRFKFDAYYDYWSQTKQYAPMTSLSDWIRNGGDYVNETDYVKVDGLNENGFLYTAKQSGRAYTQRIRFEITPGTWQQTVGVVLGYYITEDGDTSGILCCYGPNQHNEQPGIGIWQINANVYTLKTSVSATFVNGIHQMQASFNEGDITVFWKPDDQIDWIGYLQYTLIPANYSPWAMDDQGKGAVFTCNGTPAYRCFPFASDDTIIPIKEGLGLMPIAIPPSKPSPGGTFPAPGYVLVSDEVIHVSGKSPAFIPGVVARAIDGRTFPCAPRNNSGWTGVLFRHPFPGQTDQNIGNIGANAHVGRSITIECDTTIISATFRIKKTGSPGPIYCHLCTDAVDEQTYIDWTALIETSSVLAANVGTSYAEITFTFVGNPVLTRENYWFILSMTNANQTDVIDVANFYSVEMNDEVSDQEGVIRVGGTSSWFTRNPDGAMPFYVTGIGNGGDGYELYAKLDNAHAAVIPSYYTDMALIVWTEVDDVWTFHSFYRILQFDYSAPDQWHPSRPYLAPDRWDDHVGDVDHGQYMDDGLVRFFLEKEPSIPDGAIMTIANSLIIDERGSFSTIKTSHSESIVSAQQDARLKLYTGEYYTHTTDKPLAEMIGRLADKCGVFAHVSAQRIGNPVSRNNVAWNIAADMASSIQRRNFIMEIYDVSFVIGIMFRATNDYQNGYIMTFSGHGADVIHLYSVDAGVVTLFRNEYAPYNRFRVSCNDYFVSVWVGDKLIFTQHLEERGEWVGFVSNTNGIMYVDWFQLDQRIDNFVFDQGSTGDQMLSGLIGEKLAFIQADQSGGMKTFSERVHVNPGDVYDVQIIREESVVDNTPTLLRVEGLEIAESIASNIVGNYLYAQINRSEVFREDDTLNEAIRLLDEIRRQANSINIGGVADLRIQVNDIVTVETDGDDKDVIISGVSTNIGLTEGDVAFDIDLEAYDAE